MTEFAKKNKLSSIFAPLSRKKMKHNLKYGIVLALAVLLQLIMMKIAGLSSTPAGDEAGRDECFITQAYSPCEQNAYRHFHLYCSTMPCEMAHADISHVPTDKNFLRSEVNFRKYMRRKSLTSDISIHVDLYSLFDPLTYYVYELRKIII